MSRRDKILLLATAVLFIIPHMVVWSWDQPEEAPPVLPATPAATLAPITYPDPDEAALIEAALIAQGYFREDVPLDFDLQDHAQTACEEFGVPYALLLGLIETESNFDPEAVSPKGCRGLCQLNPAYFPADLEPWENIRAGAEHLGGLLKKYDTEKALVCYNMGEAGAKGIDSSAYSRAVLAAAEKWKS